MNYYLLTLKDKEGNEEEIKLRLKSADCIEIEKKTGKSLIDLAKDYSMTNLAMLLKYMRRTELPQFSDIDASNLLDKIIDNGYTVDEILIEVIYGGLSVSGFLKKEDLEEMKKEIIEAKQNKKSPQKK